jgi:glycine/D-amino acid oxidase-like deaminating enzyme
MGLTMGPMTAQLIANFVSGDKQPIPVAAYAPQRYL